MNSPFCRTTDPVPSFRAKSPRCLRGPTLKISTPKKTHLSGEARDFSDELRWRSFGFVALRFARVGLALSRTTASRVWFAHSLSDEAVCQASARPPSRPSATPSPWHISSTLPPPSASPERGGGLRTPGPYSKGILPANLHRG